METVSEFVSKKERQRQLQEYLAAKGKLKCQNAKPNLRVNNIFPNPVPSKSTTRPKKDSNNHVSVPVKTTRPLQPRPVGVTRTQKPKVEASKVLSRTSECVSSNLNCKPPSRSQQQLKTGSSTVREPSKKTVGSLHRRVLKITRKQVAVHKKSKGKDSEENAQVENETLDYLVEEINKENLPPTLSDSERKPAPEFCTVSKGKTNSLNLDNSSLAPKQTLSKIFRNSVILKDRANKQYFGKTQIKDLPIKSQQLSKGTDLTRLGDKPPRIVPSQFKTHSRTLASKKPTTKGQDIKVNRDKCERPGKSTLQSQAVHEQNTKHAKPQTNTTLVQGEINSRHPNIKQDHKFVTPFRSWAPCVRQNSKAICQRPQVNAGNPNSVIPRISHIRTNGTNENNNFQQKAQTLDSKLKKALSQNHFLNKTAPKTRTVGPTMSRRVPNGAQSNSDINKKAVEDRRKQLEEWKKAKGKVYKRPPMVLKAQKKVIEKMNVSFWKSIEKEEEERNAQLELSNKINNTLTECLQLIEEGVFSNEVFTILSSIPEAEKFAKFWICKAKLLAQKGTFDIIGLYEEAIKNGAGPILELREVVINILQDQNRKSEGITSDPFIAEELIKKMESEESSLSPEEGVQVTAIPQVTKEGQDTHPGIKLQINPIPRLIGMPEVQDTKLITPVRRSGRIEHAASRYPKMLQEHDLVVASLDELLEVEETECFIFRRNEALPVTLGFKVLES
ncbi:PREDICTED: cytoskeleton-associated protein 2-like [Elephantulus edwardii]|uniref:cytoskeleton-associated protein 2-like n=1 Tax=Elephantulus edwardii TaxID=28737 RepID=UPI0003F09DE8|nr:PREDICTED: cytoskeleton-associated protein 2-like [Elephantulus edwardii]